MSLDTYDDTDLEFDHNSIFDSALDDVENAENIGNKATSRKAARHKYLIKQKLELLEEQKYLNKQLNSFSDQWDF